MVIEQGLNVASGQTLGFSLWVGFRSVSSRHIFSLSVLLLSSLFVGLLLESETNAFQISAVDIRSVAPFRQTGSPLKVFVLAGQSNMQGHAKTSTIEVIGLDPETAPMLDEMTDENRAARVCENVWISSLGSSEKEKFGKLSVGFGAAQRGPKIGPEYTFGIYMQKLTNQPILIIKTAWGGKSLHTDFRPPSAGPFEFASDELERLKKSGKDVEKIKEERKAATGQYYRLMIEHIEKVLADIERVYPDYDPERGFELAGFVWFQGWNDMVNRQVYPNRAEPGGYDDYSQVLGHLIRDVRAELEAPNLPFVIGVMGAGGPVELYPPEKQRYAAVHSEFRKAMAAPAEWPEFKGNVTAVLTEKYWDMELESLRAKDRTLQKSVKAAKEKDQLNGQNEKQLLEKLRAETFDERERTLLVKGASNAEYHYLGSAKILGQIGRAFAESLFEMNVKEEQQ